MLTVQKNRSAIGAIPFGALILLAACGASSDTAGAGASAPSPEPSAAIVDTSTSAPPQPASTPPSTSAPAPAPTSTTLAIPPITERGSLRLANMVVDVIDIELCLD